MKNKCIVVSSMLVLALVLSTIACAYGSTATEELGEEHHSGGTLTVVTTHSAIEPPGWDIHTSPSISAAFYLSPYAEFLFIGDVLNKGPRGTNESGFNVYQAELPADLVTGNLCESYEMTTEPPGVLLHIREGIMWTGNEHIGMAPREYTAEDAAYCINRYRGGAKASKLNAFTNENPAEALDKYTVQVTFTRPFASWQWLFGYALYCNNYPKETVEAGPENWKNAVGTGPFILSDYVTGSQVIYTKNENWWNKNQIINGTEYSTPFIDKIIYPILVDESTRLAALISGQVDIMTDISLYWKKILQASCPRLNIKESPSGMALNLSFNCLSGPCADLEFRRALMLGTDQDAISAAIPGSIVGGFPFSSALGESVYTPIDEMPEEVAKLYSYDPDAAKKKIEELGYAGSKININYRSIEQDFVTAAELLADQWSKLGIEPILNLIDPAVYSGYNTGSGEEWSGVLVVDGGNGKTSRGIENERSKRYLSVYKDRDKYFDAEMTRLMAEPDADKRDAIMKEAAIYFIGTVSENALVEKTKLTCWWPWIKNYYGETEVGCSNLNPMLTTLWVDQDLKASMGY